MALKVVGSNPIIHPIKITPIHADGCYFYAVNGILPEFRDTVDTTVDQNRNIEWDSFSQMIYASAWTIAVFAYVALAWRLRVKTALHIVTFITATFDSWIVSVSWTIFSLITGH